MNNLRVLILAAHGAGDDSPANERIHELTDLVARRRPDLRVTAAFKLGSPTIADALAASTDTDTVVLPVMTSAGYFAGEYLRQCVDAAAAASSGAAYTLADPVGAGEACRELLVQRVADALSSRPIQPSDVEVVVVGHGTRRSTASDKSTLALAEAISARLPTAAVRPAFLDQPPLLSDVGRSLTRPVVVVVPFLLGGGSHALTDLPESLGLESDAAGTRSDFTANGRQFIVLDALGRDPAFLDILLEHVDRTVPRPVLRIGTRSSPLALVQAEQAIDELAALGFRTELVQFDTHGDRDQSRPIDTFPTDGPFTDELEHVLLAGTVDLVVHSLKDLPLTPTPGTVLAAYLPRGSSDEVLVTRDGVTLDGLPEGATVGTCSRRRALQIRRVRDDLACVPIRGPVQARVAQVVNGSVDALVLAAAGLERLGLHAFITDRFTDDQVLPEAGQGAIVLQARADDTITVAITRAVDDAATRQAVDAERRFSQIVTERTGHLVAVRVTTDGGPRLRGRVLSADGSMYFEIDVRGDDVDQVVQQAVDIALAQANPVRTSESRADRSAGRVSLVGAGPGDPELISVRGLILLRRADVVVYDRLVDPSLLDEAPAHAERVNAGKAPGKHELSQEAINAVLVDRALKGRRVVRLKGGDPFVFGRGSEERDACRQAGVPCEVVPGISSAIAAPGAADIPITARGLARSVAIVTAQIDPAAPAAPLDFAALARLDTVVVLMGRARLAEIAAGLIEAGRSPETPAAVVQEGTLPTQRAVSGRLDAIGRLCDDAGLRAPCVLVVGDTAARAALSETGRLAGRRIVVTRPATASRELIGMLRSEGATVINCPLIEITYERPRDVSALTRPHPWLVFTSLHSVRGYWRLLRHLGRDARSFAGMRVAAVGPRTAEELAAIGIVPDLIPAPHRASALVKALVEDARASGWARSGQRVLFPCGTLAREELRVGLAEHGIGVDELVVYDTRSKAPSPEAESDIRRGVDAILFYCPSAVHSAVRAELMGHDTAIACIGPTTAEAVTDAGYTPTVVVDRHSDEGMLEALMPLFSTPASTIGARP